MIDTILAVLIIGAGGGAIAAIVYMAVFLRD